ncbi:MAG: hypothetical protein ACOYYF_03450 [Chloroflexota bacterium]|nr:hypothetical protein [Chloroflexota bacterium]MBI5703731.1 hypothetical protein [Chloroflexota bacterium]
MNKKELAIFDTRVREVANFLSQQISKVNAIELAKQIIRGAEGGHEFDEGNFVSWLNDRFIPQTIWLSSDDYARGITRALPQALTFARSDFGSSKQRDLGQLWTDTARGLLGEIAVQRFFTEKLGLQIQQDTSLGQDLNDYISTDIKFVEEPSGKYRQAKINTSIKTGKFNARWLDEYSAPKITQIDAFIFVRLGTPKEHFVAYLKDISFLRTKLFPKAIELGELTTVSSSALWDSIPEFEPIPAYISGFLMCQDLKYPIHSVTAEMRGSENYKGRDTRKIYIREGVGVFTRNNLYALPQFQELDPGNKLKVIIEGIEKEVDNKDHFYANTGSFSYGIANWQKLTAKL